MNLRSRCLGFFLCILCSGALVGQPSPVPSSDYTVGSADVLAIGIYDEEDLSGDYTVSSDGQIVFPLLGSVAVEGKTSKEIEDSLTELLEKDFLYNATVSVRVTHYRSRTVKVLGSVVQPGVYYLDGPTKLLDVLSKAGGIASSSGEVTRGQTARVVRSSLPKQADQAGQMASQTFLVDLYELLVEGIEGTNLLLEQGDTIYVPETVLVHVVGEVKKPGSFPFEVRMTVLKAITLAGGATQKGAPRNSIVKRIREGKEVEVEVSLNDLLEPDDIVEVPRSFW